MTESTNEKLPPEKSPFWSRHRELLSILVGVVGAVLALAGAGIGANAALGGVDRQIEAQNAARSQDKRDVAYKAYLEAANNYFYAWDRFVRAETSTGRTEAANRFQSARFEYRGQTNEVWVHGSDKAVKALNAVTRTMPNSLAFSDLPPLDVLPDSAAFRDAYNDFLQVRCEEVAPVSRTGCAP